MSDLDALRQQVEAAPRDAELWFEYGHRCLDDWALDDASTAFGRVLEIDDHHRGAQLGMARSFYLSGNSSAAMVRCESVIQSDPHNGEAMLLMARIFFHDGDAESARQWLRRARMLDSSLSDAALERELAELSTLDRTDGKAFSGRPQRSGESPNRQRGGSEDDENDPFGDIDESGWEETFSLDDFTVPKTVFADVLGHDEVKSDLGMKLVYPVRHPELFKQYGKTAGGSILLFGPSGCGKSRLAKATAGEIGARFFTIGPHQLLDMYVGGSERNLHHLFELARKDSPSVIYIEEIDILVAGRNRQRSGASVNQQRGLLQQLLVELDSSDGKNDGVLIIGATSAPWHVDPAVRRPGRFDRALFVGTPDEETRAELLARLMTGKPQENLDYKCVAEWTKDFTAADLEALVEQAIDRSLMKAMETGGVLPVRTEDFLEKLSTVRASAPEWYQRMESEAANLPAGWALE